MRYRALFLSDIHLGTRDAQVERLLEFIKTHEADHLYLLGDIIDGWELGRRWRWPQSHSNLIQKLLRAARKGTSITYVVGNHDDFLRPFLPITLGERLFIVDRAEYTTPDGRRYALVHGDMFDSITMTKKWLALLGDKSYLLLLRLNRPLAKIRSLLGFRRHWSLSQFAKRSVKQAVAYIDDYETILSTFAKEEGVDGVICGHIHEAANKMMNGIHYLNCGDWVESCTAVAHCYDGSWMILDANKDLSDPLLYR
ncbi:MAG: UDP-2,3-diacylglucosamine diphosphatase [Campylobacterales bacterium]